MKKLLYITLTLLGIIYSSCSRFSSNEAKMNSELDSLKNKAIEHMYYEKFDDYIAIRSLYKSKSYQYNHSKHIAYYHYIEGTYFKWMDVYDSAYYHYNISNKLYRKLNDVVMDARSTYNIAQIQYCLGNYNESIFNLFSSLRQLTNDEAKFQIYPYNLLGSIYSDLNKQEEALVYYNKSKELLGEIDLLSKVTGEYPFNIRVNRQFGVFYLNQKKYDEALAYFQKNEELMSTAFDKDIAQHKMYLNLTKAYLGELSKQTESNLLESLELLESYDYKNGQILANLSLAQFYNLSESKSKAIDYATKALILAKQIRNYNSTLESLKWLSEFDIEHSDQYQQEKLELEAATLKSNSVIEYQKINRVFDSSEKFKEKSNSLDFTNRFLLVILFLAIVVFRLIVYIVKQRANQKHLSLLNELEKDKLEIYKMALKNQEKLEEGKKAERQRISMELHDGILGSIASIRFSINLLRSKSSKTNHEELIPEEYEKELARIEKEIRTLSHDLNTEQFQNSSFSNLLVHKLKSTQSLKVSINFNDEIEWELISDIIKSNVYRIVQEVYQNTIKHSKASILNISISNKDEICTIKIKDDGKGFDTNKNYEGIGLKNIKMRVKEYLKGSFQINSNSYGTTIIISFRLKEEQ